jgi:hypothetical protein
LAFLQEKYSASDPGTGIEGDSDTSEDPDVATQAAPTSSSAAIASPAPVFPSPATSVVPSPAGSSDSIGSTPSNTLRTGPVLAVHALPIVRGTGPSKRSPVPAIQTAAPVPFQVATPNGRIGIAGSPLSVGLASTSSTSSSARPLPPLPFKATA